MKQTNETSFIKKNKIEPYYERAKENIPDIWNMLQAISIRYNEYTKNCNGVLERLSKEIMSDSSSELAQSVHSIRYRVKDSNSLQIKIIKKVSELPKKPSDNLEIEKYRQLSADNYDKILTDLIGFRIILRYREQWSVIHNWIMKLYFHGTDLYVNDYINDFKPNPPSAHIAERPKVYYRNTSDKALYEQIGGDFYSYIHSDEGYNSVHYILNIDGKYVELQVRTIFDEAWSECTHDLVYKNKTAPQIEELNYLSRCLSEQTIAAESIVNLMYKKTHKNSILFSNNTASMIDKSSAICKNEQASSVVSEEQSQIAANMERRMNENQTLTHNFNGNIKDLL